MGPRKLSVYKTYRFIDHDPVIDVMRTLIGDRTFTSIHKESNVGSSTLANWMNGETKRPKYSTIAAVVYALGGKISIVDQAGRSVNPSKTNSFRRRKGK